MKSEDGKLNGDAVPIEVNPGFRRVGAGVPGLRGFIGLISAEQKNFDVLGTVGKDVDLDAGIAPGGAVEHGTRQIGSEVRHLSHDVKGRCSQLPQAIALFVFLIDGLVGPQFGFHLVVAGQGLVVAKAKATRGLALGVAVVVDAIFGHQTRGQTGHRATCELGRSA